MHRAAAIWDQIWNGLDASGFLAFCFVPTSCLLLRARLPHQTSQGRVKVKSVIAGGQAAKHSQLQVWTLWRRPSNSRLTGGWVGCFLWQPGAILMSVGQCSVAELSFKQVLLTRLSLRAAIRAMTLAAHAGDVNFERLLHGPADHTDLWLRPPGGKYNTGGLLRLKRCACSNCRRFGRNSCLCERRRPS